jgi:hypothetical protein
MQNAFAGITFQGDKNIKWGWKNFPGQEQVLLSKIDAALH